MFKSVAKINSPIVSSFVNNIKIMGAINFEVISWVNEELTVVFKMIDIESISFYLNLKVSQDHK